jgi:hypothetical protein
MRPVIVETSRLNSTLRRYKPGEKPLIKPVVMKANKQTLRKAKYFFHVGQRRGSLTSSEGCGTSTTFVPRRWMLRSGLIVSGASLGVDVREGGTERYAGQLTVNQLHGFLVT